MAIVPTVVSCLASLLEAKAPFPQRPTDAHCLFVRAILTLMSYPYTAIIKDQLLGVGISHLLRIDVFVGREVEEHRGLFLITGYCFSSLGLTLKCGLRANGDYGSYLSIFSVLLALVEKSLLKLSSDLLF